MKIGIYEDGNKESSRVYIGKVPRVIEEGNWKCVYPIKQEYNSTPRKLAEAFQKFIEDYSNLKPTWLDLNSGVSGSALEYGIPSDKLSKIIDQFFLS